MYIRNVMKINNLLQNDAAVAVILGVVMLLTGVAIGAWLGSQYSTLASTGMDVPDYIVLNIPVLGLIYMGINLFLKARRSRRASTNEAQ